MIRLCARPVPVAAEAGDGNTWRANTRSPDGRGVATNSRALAVPSGWIAWCGCDAWASGAKIVSVVNARPKLRSTDDNLSMRRRAVQWLCGASRTPRGIAHVAQLAHAVRRAAGHGRTI